MPTSILIELLLSGGVRKECTQMSFSFTTSATRGDIVTRMTYLERRREKNVGLKNRKSYEPQLDVDGKVAVVLLLNILERKSECLSLSEFSESSIPD
jgi:hypothetical protein